MYNILWGKGNPILGRVEESRGVQISRVTLVKPPQIHTPTYNSFPGVSDPIIPIVKDVNYIELKAE